MRRDILLTGLISGLLVAGGGCNPQPPAPGLIAVDRRPYPDHGVVAVRGGHVVALFKAEALGHILQLDVLRSRRQCVVAYVAPPRPGEPAAGASLYTFGLEDADAGKPASLQTLLAAGPEENLLDPAVSADQGTLYYVRVVRTADDPQPRFTVALEALDLASGRRRPLLDNAIWPDPSADGRWLAVVTVEPDSAARGLAVYDLERGSVAAVVEPGRFVDVDAPVFDPGSEWVHFFGTQEYVAGRSTFSLWALMGIAQAEAHSNEPGRWWKVRRDGTDLQLVTDELEIISHGAGAGSDGLIYSSSLGVRLLASGKVATVIDAPWYGALAVLGE